MERPPYITIALIREAIQDRTPEDNSIECDLFFSDEEIKYAIERAASQYNSLSPLGIDVVHEDRLPSKPNLFVDAVLANLYKTANHKLARNVMTWQTGNSTVEIEKTRLELFSKLANMLEAEWKEEAKERKMEINRALAWGNY